MKIVVSQAKFDEACTRFGSEQVCAVMAVRDSCDHQWSLKVVTHAFTGDCYAFLECGDCGETKDHLDLLD